ncbi:lipid A biosynthesis acyltransferase [Dethiosulfovibrio peptidovorans DSM 11002]|uniref:Lipid A biosynthesis acyltransferase n=1 Tax=Dethiosulfovibrio peptidovorans DSM 11002 TaxID=469381 RepID=D2Z8C2_9BACT|nr:lysophospholipid acyltransferase family protein [Dethiosulfovibrio peptidovorans]EFC91719.1 lipid A biosynthesis acyltransferase [Dethiosulfovibrio peptidovorans DSM 11002]
MSIRVRCVEMLARWVRPGWRAWTLYFFLRCVLGLISPRKTVALDNMARAFPDRDEQWCRENLKAVYDHFCWMVVEYLALVNDPSQALTWIDKVEGKDILDDLLSSKKGCVILASHGGNWELLSAWLCRSDYPLYAAVRDPDAEDLAVLMESYRQKVGLKTLRKERKGFREMVRLPMVGNFVGLVADQDGGPTGIPVKFLGRPCTMPKGPAAISVMSKVPIIPVSIERIAPFRHKVRVYSPLSTSETVKGKEDKVVALAAEVNGALEDMVRAVPGEWLWMHRRWKTDMTGKNSI